MKLTDIDFLEICVEDAEAIADLYERTFGFHRIAEAGPETGLEGHRSVVLAQGTAKLIITSSIDGSGSVAEFTQRHGDGVRDIAFTVDDATGAFKEAVARGATPIREPIVWTEGGSRVIRATIGGFGDVVHSFVQWDGPQHAPLPTPYRPIKMDSVANSNPFTAIDHVAICLNIGTLDKIAECYKRVLDFEDGHKEYVETDLSGMNARVVQHGRIKFPLQEPLRNNPSGPIAEFIDLNCGPGVYHVALLTDDIVHTLRGLRKNHVNGLHTPPCYYDMLPDRVGAIEEEIEDLRNLNVLVDRDQWGYLLQVFTRSLHKRKTLFFEVIQRKKARGFGSANIRALFDAVESDRRALAAREA